MNLDDDTTTSFWHDEWAEADRLTEHLPALYSHCRDMNATVEEVVARGVLTCNQLQARVSLVAQHELLLLEDALSSVELRDCPDMRRMAALMHGRIYTATFYSTLREMTPTPPSSIHPRRSGLSFRLARQMDGGRNNASNKVRYVPNNAPMVGPKKSDHAFAGFQNQLHVAHRQGLERVKRWKDNQQLLMAMMKSFCRERG
jgi:hypothetical protein